MVPPPSSRTPSSGRSEGRFAGLARVTAQLGLAQSVDDVTTIITEQAAAALDADAAILVVREGHKALRTVGAQGLTAQQQAEFARFDVSRQGPIGEAVRTAMMVIVEGRDDLRARYPDLDDGSELSSVTLPLLTGDGTQTLGAIAFRFDDRSTVPLAGEVAVLQVVADLCAQILQRLEAQEQSAEHEARLQFLADASQLLASSLDHRETLSRVAALAVPRHADWCSVEIMEDGALRTLAVAHVDPDKVALAHELQERWPSDPNAPNGAAQVARSGESMLVEEVLDEMLVAAARDEEHLRIARELGLRSALSVPLIAHSRVLGVLTFVSAESGRRYTPADVPFAEDLARRAALAIDNADLYSQTRRVAAELQLSLLPEQLPRIEGWQLGAVYRQSGRTEVGGDFYDVVPVGDGRIAVVIGDVMGRGADAAVAGARMRAAARVLLSQDPHPLALARAMDQLMVVEAMTPLATAAYLLFDPANDCVEAVVAGHLPPLLLHADGTSRYVTEASSPLLGVGPVDRDSARLDFAPGDALLLYTDGLVERRDEGIDEGLARLRHRASELATVPPGDTTALAERLSQVVESVMCHERADDIAALVLLRSP